MEETKKEWRLENLTIQFKPGYSFNNTKDHYAGKITFKNKENESFTFNLTNELTQPYIDLIKKEVIRTATTLGDKLANSLK